MQNLGGKSCRKETTCVNSGVDRRIISKWVLKRQYVCIDWIFLGNTRVFMATVINSRVPQITPRSRILIERPVVPQHDNKFPVLHQTLRFSTFFAQNYVIFPHWAKLIHSSPPWPISWKYILILSSQEINFRDRRLPPLLNWILLSSGLLRSVRYIKTDVSEQSIGPVFKDRAVLGILGTYI